MSADMVSVTVAPLTATSVTVRTVVVSPSTELSDTVNTDAAGTEPVVEGPVEAAARPD